MQCFGLKDLLQATVLDTLYKTDETLHEVMKLCTFKD